MGKRVLRVCRHFHENRCSSLQRKTQNKRNKLQEIITTKESGHIKHVCCLSKTVFERLTDDVGFWIAEKNGKQGEKVQKQTSKQDKVCLFFFFNKRGGDIESNNKYKKLHQDIVKIKIQ